MKATNNIIAQFLIICCLSACSGPHRAEEFGAELFEAIRENDQDRFDSLILTEADVEDFLRTSDYDESEKEKVRRNLIGYKIPAWKVHSKSELRKLHGKMGQLGLNWEEAQVDSTVIDLSKNKAKADIFIHFHVDTARFKIKADDCIRADRGWVIMDDVTLWEIRGGLERSWN